MKNKKYWQSFGDFNNSEAFQGNAANEFKEELLPMEDLDSKGLLDAKTPRRDFLKYLGFSTAAATIAASCEMPVRKAIPYLNRPENITPGVANYFASTYVNGGDVLPVVVKTREGRPIKIEGNDLSPLTGGGTNAQAQAAVLDLYDPTRLRHPLQKSNDGFKEIPTFDMVDQMIADGVKNLGGKALVLLTSTICSPSTLDIISNLLAKVPGSRHLQYDALSYTGMLLANEASYGRRALPTYQFDKAKVIVSLGADFLGTWLNPVEYAHQYAKNRKVNGSVNPQLNRHIQFESMMSLTGSNADDRYNHKPSQTGAIASALLGKVAGGGGTNINDATLAKAIDSTAALLNANKGAALVVSGSNDVNVQIVVNAINEAIGANGTTINWGATNNTKKGIDADIVTLTNDMASGTVGGVMVFDCNPAYTYADGKKFADALAKVPFSVSFSSTMDETSEQCKLIIPSHHWLESWGDAEAQTGSLSFQQPVINPLFKTRPFQTTLLKIANGISSPKQVVAADTTGSAPVIATTSTTAIPGNLNEYENYFKQYWTSKLGANGYNKALQDGIATGTGGAQVAGGGYNAGRLADATAKLAGAKAGEYEVVLYQKVSMGRGSQANNPWLQELPDPITKVTWDNYAMISPALAKKVLGIDVIKNQRQADAYEVTPEKPTLKVTVNGKTLELPAVIIPGVNPNTIAIAVGYGRASADSTNTKERIGQAARGAGQNAFPLVAFDGTSMQYSSAATIAKGDKEYKIAQTQVHGFTENRPVIYETNLKSFVANPKDVLAEATHERAILLPEGKTDYVRDATMYPDYVKPGVKWGMSIDLNTCTGCSACVIACTAENNIPVVGKTEVARAHEMHWLRIDRYFTGDTENPDVVFQPMLCQHCDNAPCENVCPVAATNHSSEGLNQMTYNRCIGTRYCANNCPYKVRRFNWLDYTGSDSFPNNQKPINDTYLDDAVFQMNEELPRMVLNPDVTVRARGVIEKCSFCVQRLQDSKLEAKKHGDASLVRNVKTACAQACPTNAITFGNVNDPQSEVSIARKDANRNFYVMEQLHVLPNVSYLAKIRNTDREVTNEAKEEHMAADAPKAEAEKH